MKFSIRNKMNIIFVILIIVPLSTMGIGTYMQSRSIIEEDLIRLSESTLSGVKSSIDRYLKQYESTIYLVAQNANIKSALAHPEYKPWILDLFNGVLDSSDDIKHIYIGILDKRLIIYPEVELGDDFVFMDRPWYVKAVKEQKTIWTEPYVDEDSKELVVSIATPIIDQDNKFIGVVGIDINLDGFVSYVNKQEIGNNSQCFIVDNNGRFISHRDTDFITKKIDNEQLIESMIQGEDNVEIITNGEKHFYSFDQIGNTNWMVVADLSSKDILIRSNKMLYTAGWIGGISVIFALLIAFIFSGYFKNTIHKILNGIIYLRQGRLDTKVQINSRDEFAELADGFNGSMDNLSSLINSTKAVSNNGTKLAEHLSAISEECSAISEDVTSRIDDIATMAKKQAKQSHEGSQHIEVLSTQLHQISLIFGQITSSIEQVGLVKEDGLEAMEQLQARNERTHESTKDIQKTVKSLEENSVHMHQILETISTISEQTNLLALNAAIEAARAGEQGRGFAVVSESIRSLAQQSKEAVVHIHTILKEIQSTTNSIINAIDTNDTVIEEQSKTVAYVNESFRGIDCSTEKLPTLIAQANNMVKQMVEAKDTTVEVIKTVAYTLEESSTVLDDVNASVKTQSQAISDVAQCAAKLNEESTTLDGCLGNFITVD